MGLLYKYCLILYKKPMLLIILLQVSVTNFLTCVWVHVWPRLVRAFHTGFSFNKTQRNFIGFLLSLILEEQVECHCF